MKKRNYIIQFFVIIISCTIFLGGYGAYKFLGDIVFKSIINSLGGDVINNAESTLKDLGVIRNDTVISESDKNNAIELLKSKFTAAEISRYMAKFAEGKISEVLPEIKQKLKERCTEEEIELIKSWYEKYTK